MKFILICPPAFREPLRRVVLIGEIETCSMRQASILRKAYYVFWFVVVNVSSY